MKFVFKFSFQLLLSTGRKRYERKVDHTLTDRSTPPVEERKEEHSVVPLSPISEKLVRETSFSEEQISRIFAEACSPDGTKEEISPGKEVKHTVTDNFVGATEGYREKRRVIPLSPTSERLIRETRFSADHINKSFAKARGLDTPKDEESPEGFYQTRTT